MSNYSPTEYKAIGWYADKINAVPQISAWPNVRFIVRDTKEEITRNIKSIGFEYTDYVKELNKEKARQRRADKKKKEAHK